MILAGLIRAGGAVIAVGLCAYAAMVFVTASKEALLFIYLVAVVGLAWLVWVATSRLSGAVARKHRRDPEAV